MNIRIANKSDLSILVHYDKHISGDELAYSMMRERILIIEENNHLIGWLRYNLFWDNMPFMNMLYILEDYRGKRYGKVLTLFWEEQMKRLGYELVMTSTLSNEGAQHFYRKLGYTDAGSLLLPQEPLEIIFIKSI